MAAEEATAARERAARERADRRVAGVPGSAQDGAGRVEPARMGRTPLRRRRRWRLARPRQRFRSAGPAGIRRRRGAGCRCSESRGVFLGAAVTATRRQPGEASRGVGRSGRPGGLQVHRRLLRRCGAEGGCAFRSASLPADRREGSGRRLARAIEKELEAGREALRREVESARARVVDDVRETLGPEYRLGADSSSVHAPVPGAESAAAAVDRARAEFRQDVDSARRETVQAVHGALGGQARFASGRQDVVPPIPDAPTQAVPDTAAVAAREARAEFVGSPRAVAVGHLTQASLMVAAARGPESLTRMGDLIEKSPLRQAGLETVGCDPVLVKLCADVRDSGREPSPASALRTLAADLGDRHLARCREEPEAADRDEAAFASGRAALRSGRVRGPRGRGRARLGAGVPRRDRRACRPRAVEGAGGWRSGRPDPEYRGAGVARAHARAGGRARGLGPRSGRRRRRAARRRPQPSRPPRPGLRAGGAARRDPPRPGGGGGVVAAAPVGHVGRRPPAQGRRVGAGEQQAPDGGPRPRGRRSGGRRRRFVAGRGPRDRDRRFAAARRRRPRRGSSPARAGGRGARSAAERRRADVGRLGVRADGPPGALGGLPRPAGRGGQDAARAPCRPASGDHRAGVPREGPGARGEEVGRSGLRSAPRARARRRGPGVGRGLAGPGRRVVRRPRLAVRRPADPSRRGAGAGQRGRRGQGDAGDLRGAASATARTRG